VSECVQTLKVQKVRTLSPCEPTHTHTILALPFASKERKQLCLIPKCVYIGSPTLNHAGQPVGGSEVKSGVKFHRPPKNCSDVCNVTATRLSMRSLREVIVLPLKAIHKGQGLNLYRPSVKHKSTYVNQQSKRNDHKQASEREKWGREA